MAEWMTKIRYVYKSEWTWVWVGSRSWWWTGRPGVLQSVGLQRVRHDWVTELTWTDRIECYLTMKRHEVLIHGAAQKNREALCWEKPVIKKSTYCMILFIWNFQNRQIHRKWMSGFLVLKGKEGKCWICKWIWVSFWGDGNILKQTVGTAAQLCKCTNLDGSYTLNGWLT